MPSASNALSASSDTPDQYFTALANETDISDGSFEKTSLFATNIDVSSPGQEPSLMQSISESQLGDDLSISDDILPQAKNDRATAVEESEEERLRRELEESERLALQLSTFFFIYISLICYDL